MNRNKTKRAALYLRVSTDGQTTENQRIALETVAQNAGWDIVAVYDDNGVSGAKGRDQRKQFDALIKDANRRKFDVVMAWSVDRLGRSLQDLLQLLGDLEAVGVDLFLQQQGLDTTTPSGKMLFQMSGVFAEFERSMIQERVKAGLERAKAKGKTLGRPKVTEEKEQAIIDLRSQGKGIRKIASEIGVGVGTVQRVVKEVEVA
ncbi:recombinase family protein [Terasakiella pusilla]|uniref:recombinase family protein n=1 Tax=Terasakiella pusilla TaxID=64973 RepID=UPI003AA9CABD